MISHGYGARLTCYDAIAFAACIDHLPKTIHCTTLGTFRNSNHSSFRTRSGGFHVRSFSLLRKPCAFLENAINNVFRATPTQTPRRSSAMSKVIDEIILDPLPAQVWLLL
jgi:hypothetical protein